MVHDRFAPDVSLEEPRRQNLYTYSGNNPLRYVDPDGRAPLDHAGLAFKTAQMLNATKTPLLDRAASQIIDELNPLNMAKGLIETIKDPVGAVKGMAGSLKDMAVGIASGDPEAIVDGVVAVGVALLTKKAPVKAAGGGSKVGNLPKPPTGKGSVPKSQRDPKRVWTPKERAAKRKAQGDKCATGCGTEIDETNSRGHHKERHADGGKTDDANHAEVCVDCHPKLHSPD